MKINKQKRDSLLCLLKRKITLLSKITALFLLLNFAASTILSAQRNQGVPVTGQIVDENNNPLTGVTVQVKNSKISATTNAAGKFSITVPNNRSVLVFTYVGYERQESVAGNNKVIHLQASNTNLGEVVVVVGYGTQRRISVTGSVDRVGTQVEKTFAE